jgi:hypothetical protein
MGCVFIHDSQYQELELLDLEKNAGQVLAMRTVQAIDHIRS